MSMPSCAAPFPACTLSSDLLKLLMGHAGALGLTSPQTPLPGATPTSGRWCWSGAGAVFAQLVHSGLHLVSILQEKIHSCLNQAGYSTIIQMYKWVPSLGVGIGVESGIAQVWNIVASYNPLEKKTKIFPPQLFISLSSFVWLVHGVSVLWYCSVQ